MATASATRMWRARPEPHADLALPAATEHSLWIQVIDGELELRNDNGSTYPLQRGDGVGIVDSPTGRHTLVGMNRTSDVLLLALNKNPSVVKQADGGT